MDKNDKPTTQPAYRRGVVPMTFIGGDRGKWKIRSMTAVAGEGLPMAACLDVQPVHVVPNNCRWALKGVAGQARYVERSERGPLDVSSPPLGRPEATTAVLIPMSKTDAWWVMTQDERRAIFEERSHHIGLSMKYLPAIARGLYHCRDLGEPFDFLAWFEFAPEYEGAFDEMLVELRSTEEWKYVDHEIEIRVAR